MTVSDALRADLVGMPKAVQDSTLAAVAVELASVLDGMPGARDAASVAKELRATMAELKTMAEQVPAEEDPVDELSRRRHDRVADPSLQDRSTGGGLNLG